MAERVLVAVDGTKASNMALEIACALADSYKANLGLLCVIEPDNVSDDFIKGALIEGVLQKPSYHTWYHSAMGYIPDLGIEERAQRADYVAQLSKYAAESIVAAAEAYSKKSAAKVVKTFVRSGNVADEILAVAKENGVDVIVMGHDQRGRLEALIEGSVAEHVAREATCACLVYCQPKQD